MYPISEVSRLTGLPTSTLRYYESIKLTPHIARNKQNGHRLYSQKDVELLSRIACLVATGMPLNRIRQYISRADEGSTYATEQAELLAEHDAVLQEQEEQIVLRRAYIQLKIKYWQLLKRGSADLAEGVSQKAYAIACELRKQTPNNYHKRTHNPFYIANSISLRSDLR